METEKKVIAVVRALPIGQHKRRWCGLEAWVPDPKHRPSQEMEELPTGGLKPKFDRDGNPVYAKHALPWPAFEIKVEVVDKPAPFDPDANGGVPTQISRTTLAMLHRDPRIVVTMHDGRDVLAEQLASELGEAKLEAVATAEKLRATERQLAALQERNTAAFHAAESNAGAVAAAEIAKIRGELDELRMQIGRKSK